MASLGAARRFEPTHEPEAAAPPRHALGDAGPSGSAIAGFTAAAYVAATSLTEPIGVADTPDMAVSAVGHALGADCGFFESGHLLWRPAGYVMLRMFGTVTPGASTDSVLRASELHLGWVAWGSGLVAAMCTALWLRGKVRGATAVFVGVGMVLLGKAFLNFSQVGISYIPALATLMLALLILSRPVERTVWDVVAGVLLATSVLLWGTFALALPAALAAPLLFSSRPGAVARSLRAVAGGAAGAIAATAWVFTAKGFSSLSEFTAWVGSASHGITTGGFQRAVLGFARSFFETGDYGRLVKRFLLEDPADPVAVRELFGLPLFGILAFYVVLVMAVVIVARGGGRRALAFAALNAIPVGLFAIAWQGGDLERYLPLVPGVALLMAVAFDGAGTAGRTVIVGFLAMIAVPNAVTLGTSAVEAERERLRATLRPVEAQGERRMVVLTHWQDPRMQFRRNYPPDADPLPLRFYHLLTPGTSSVEHWRSETAARIRTAWERGQAVYVTERLLSPTARREWAWVDGDDPRVRWKDLYHYFSALEYGKRVGVAGDGFVALPRTARNSALLTGEAAPRRCRLPETIPGSGT